MTGDRVAEAARQVSREPVPAPVAARHAPARQGRRVRACCALGAGRPAADLLAVRDLVQDAVPGRQGPVLHPVRRLPADARRRGTTSSSSSATTRSGRTSTPSSSACRARSIALILGSTRGVRPRPLQLQPAGRDHRAVHRLHRLRVRSPPRSVRRCSIAGRLRARRSSSSWPRPSGAGSRGPSATATSRSG